MNQLLHHNIRTEDDFSLCNDESFEENYEEMINSFLNQRHVYSASLPLPMSTDAIIDQIQCEKNQMKKIKDSMKYQLRLQVLKMIKPCLSKVEFTSKPIIEATEEYTDDMKEIVEVTSSAEQSPTGIHSPEINFEIYRQEYNDIDEFSDIGADISQEIK